MPAPFTVNVLACAGAFTLTVWVGSMITSLAEVGTQLQFQVLGDDQLPELTLVIVAGERPNLKRALTG